MRWVHISLHRTEIECRIELRVATFEKGGFPLSERLKIAKTIFLTQLWKKRCISKTKTSKVGPFYFEYTYIWKDRNISSAEGMIKRAARIISTI